MASAERCEATKLWYEHGTAHPRAKVRRKGGKALPRLCHPRQKQNSYVLLKTNESGGRKAPWCCRKQAAASTAVQNVVIALLLESRLLRLPSQAGCEARPGTNFFLLFTLSLFLSPPWHAAITQRKDKLGELREHFA